MNRQKPQVQILIFLWEHSDISPSHAQPGPTGHACGASSGQRERSLFHSIQAR